jgi:hypothetical protein
VGILMAALGGTGRAHFEPAKEAEKRRPRETSTKHTRNRTSFFIASTARK